MWDFISRQFAASQDGISFSWMFISITLTVVLGKVLWKNRSK